MTTNKSKTRRQWRTAPRKTASQSRFGRSGRSSNRCKLIGRTQTENRAERTKVGHPKWRQRAQRSTATAASTTRAAPVPVLNESTPAPPMDHTSGPAARIARKQANSRKAAGAPPKANSVRRPREPRARRTSTEPTYTQVPVDAGYATPIPKAGTAESIPTARLVTEDEMQHHQ